MVENSFEVQYDITKRSKLKKFYELNKILILDPLLGVETNPIRSNPGFLSTLAKTTP